MTAAATTPAEILLGALRANRHATTDLEVERLELTIDWAAEHTVTADGDWAAHQVGIFGDRALPVAGEGAPLVSEFAIMEYAATLAMSTDAGKAYVGNALELRYRLPRLWAHTVAGRLPVWRALRVAEHTCCLPAAAAAEVDRALAPVAGTCSWAQLDRLVEEALARHDPAEAEDRRRRAADGRRFDVETDRADTSGTVEVHGRLDLADALDLDAAISKTATQLGDLGSTEPLDVRRSLAAGEIARHQLALDLTTGEIRPQGRGRSVVLNVHLTEDALVGVGNVGRCATTRTPVTVEQIRQWCRTAGQIRVVPVKDLTAHHHVEAYEIPDRLRDQVDARDVHCVFPYCQRRAERCDHDHIDPHDRDGPGAAPTCTDNIAPLCRRHHRAKTHGRWTYQRIHATGYEWTTPHGYRIVRDHHGTHEARPPER